MTSLSLAAVLVAASSLPACEKASAGATFAPASVERGRYLTVALGCADCHTPWHVGPNGPEPDASRGLSGHPAELVMPPAPELPEGPWLVSAAATNTAWAGPWGVSFTSNLTPDVETGIGSWSEDTFLASLRTGKHLGMGRPILPPMPWPGIGRLTDDDLRAIFAYLKSQPAVSNRVPEPLPPRG
ncbi:MAG: c-type cytochrome [Planctomycetes bacterium]|nr:c-type cytochrome [Planctomycetota bacterium]